MNVYRSRQFSGIVRLLAHKNAGRSQILGCRDCPVGDRPSEKTMEDERMNDQALWNLIRATADALGARYEPVIERFVAESGLEPRAWGLLLAVLTFEPDHTTPGHLLVRNPYTAAEAYLARLEAVADMGYLRESGEAEFYLTRAGRSETERFIAQLRAALVVADPLSPAAGLRLAELLGRLVRHSLETPPPPNNWSIRLSYKLMPDIDPPLPFIEQAISCLAAYRDDAHLAAWRESGLAATALETLTLLWRDQADSLPSLVQRLAHRGHAAQIYVDAVAELRARKFVAGTERSLRITSKGNLFREQVEADTDRYFFAPWNVLSEAEKVEMEGLFTRLKDGLTVEVA